MKGMFVNENGTRYAWAIVSGIKTIETRNRNMLSALVGERVAVIRTKSGEKPCVVGYVDITHSAWIPKATLNSKAFRDMTLIPVGSEYDCTGSGKYGYFLAHAERVEPPMPLPENAVRHGRSWCEF